MTTSGKQCCHYRDLFDRPALGPDCTQIDVDCAGVEMLDAAALRFLLEQAPELRIHFVNGAAPVFEALALMAGKRDWRFGGGFTLTRIPIRVYPAETGPEWRIHLAADADWAGWMKDQDSVVWVRHLTMQRLWVDLVDLGRLRSVVIGWLLSLRQELPQVPISLINVDARALSVLQQMRLGSVFEIDGLEGDPGVGSSGLRRLIDNFDNG